MIKNFEKSMSNKGIKFRDNKHLHSMFFRICFDDLVEKYLPKSNTIESFIMSSVHELLLDTYYEVANLLFPNNNIIICDKIILLPDHKMVFDIYKYYYEIEIDHDYYDKLCNEFYEDLELSSDSSADSY